jgi:hypothetical protein
MLQVVMMRILWLRHQRRRKNRRPSNDARVAVAGSATTRTPLTRSAARTVVAGVGRSGSVLAARLEKMPHHF